MKKKKAFISVLYLTSIVLLPSCISFLIHKSVEFGVLNLRNTIQSEIVFNTLQEKSMIEKFIELEELFFLDEMIKEYPEPSRQKFIMPIHKETIQLIKMYNEERIQTFFHFLTNIICFIILRGYFIRGNEELRFLNSWIQEFLYNLSDTIKAFVIILVTDFCVGFHSTRIWELMIQSVYKEFGFPHNDLIISILLSSCPVILDTIFKYSIFFYLNRISPSLVVIYHSMKE